MTRARMLIAAIAITTLASAAPTLAGKAGDPLDGKTFDVRLVMGDNKTDPDQLIFTSGTFESTACRAHQFTAAEYRATKEKDGIRFEATTSSPSEGTILWSGIVHGKHVEGTMTMTNPKGEIRSATFHGEQAGEPSHAMKHASGGR